MVKKFVAIKTSLLLAMLIISIFTALSFNASARIFKIEPIISVTHEKPTEKVIPKGGVLNINLSTSFTLTGIGSTLVQKRGLLKDSAITITLDVSTDYDWADVSITNSPATLKVSEPDTKWYSEIQLAVTEKAPAFILGKVTVTARSSRLDGLVFFIEEITETFEVPFEVGYWGATSIDLTADTFEVAPYNTTKIPMNIKNLGNGITQVHLEIIESPVNWNISLPDSIILEPFEGEKTVFLEVITDHEFEEETIKIKTIAHYLGQPNLQGHSEIITFTIKNDGSYKDPSNDTFEIDTTMLAIMLLIILVIILIVVFIKRK